MPDAHGAKLELGQNLGTLHLTLRNPKDTQDAQARVATIRDVRYFQGKPVTQSIKEWLESTAKALAQMRAAKPTPPKPEKVVENKPEEKRPDPPAIRELRGTASSWLQWR